jgi:hypothetical protein
VLIRLPGARYMHVVKARSGGLAALNNDELSVLGLMAAVITPVSRSSLVEWLNRAEVRCASGRPFSTREVRAALRFCSILSP